MKIRSLVFALAVAPALLSTPAARAVIAVNDSFDATTHPGASRTSATGLAFPFYPVTSETASQTATIGTDATTGFTSSVLALNGDTNSGSSFPIIGLLPGSALLTNVNDS